MNEDLPTVRPASQAGFDAALVRRSVVRSVFKPKSRRIIFATNPSGLHSGAQHAVAYHVVPRIRCAKHMRITTFIRCDQPLDGLSGLVIEGELLVPDEAPEVASCTHNVVDIPDSLSMTIRYPRVLLKDWKAIEDAARATLGRYEIR